LEQMEKDKKHRAALIQDFVLSEEFRTSISCFVFKTYPIAATFVAALETNSS
jgi:hypothetical protein